MARATAEVGNNILVMGTECGSTSEFRERGGACGCGPGRGGLGPHNGQPWCLSKGPELCFKLVIIKMCIFICV